MNQRKSVIAFSHIAELPEEEVSKLKQWYCYYHKLAVCYEWKNKKLKKVKLALTMTSIALVTVGAGIVTMNPVILGVIRGSGVLIQGYVTKSNIPDKIHECKFAYTSYEKILIQLRNYLRGLPYDEIVFLSDTKVLDDIVIDMCPPINGMAKRYMQKYVT